MTTYSFTESCFVLNDPLVSSACPISGITSPSAWCFPGLERPEHDPAVSTWGKQGSFETEWVEGNVSSPCFDEGEKYGVCVFVFVKGCVYEGKNGWMANIQASVVFWWRLKLLSSFGYLSVGSVLCTVNGEPFMRKIFVAKNISHIEPLSHLIFMSQSTWLFLVALITRCRQLFHAFLFCGVKLRVKFCLPQKFLFLRYLCFVAC